MLLQTFVKIMEIFTFVFHNSNQPDSQCPAKRIFESVFYIILVLCVALLMRCSPFCLFNSLSPCAPPGDKVVPIYNINYLDVMPRFYK